jgi:tetratricopeptide (TPR) repeat protein
MEGTMRRSCLLGGSLIAAMSTAAMADDKRDCLQHKVEAIRIKACSAVIQHGPRDAVAYYNRGLAYVTSGDVENAVADYSKAIAINPNYAPAYDSRGRAYASKGDYTNAIADVSKAADLVPKDVRKGKVTTPTVLKAKGPTPIPKALAPKAVSPSPRKPRSLAPASDIEPVPANLWPKWALRSLGDSQ